MAFDSQSRMNCPICLEPTGEQVPAFSGKLVCCQCGCIFPDRPKSNTSDATNYYIERDSEDGQNEYWNNYMKRLSSLASRQQGVDRSNVAFHLGLIGKGLSQAFKANGWRTISLLYSTRQIHQQYSSGSAKNKIYNNSIFLRDLYTMELIGCANLAVCHPREGWIDMPRKIKEIVLLVLITGGVFSLVVPLAFSYALEGDFIAAKGETLYSEEMLYTEEAVRRLLWPEFKIVSQKKIILGKNMADEFPNFIKDDPRLSQTQREIMATHLQVEAIKT